MSMMPDRGSFASGLPTHLPPTPFWRPPGWDDDCFHFAPTPPPSPWFGLGGGGGLPVPLCPPTPPQIFCDPVFPDIFPVHDRFDWADCQPPGPPEPICTLPPWTPTPLPQFNPTAISAKLPAFMTDGHGHAPYGSGNPDTGFNIQTSIDGGLIMAFKVKFRQGEDAQTSVDNKGVFHFWMPEGPQVPDPEHGVSGGNAARLTWNWDYVLGATNGNSLLDYNVHMKISFTDLNGHTSSVDLHMVPAPAGNPGGSHSGVAWEDEAHHVFYFGDGGGIFNQVEGNSEQAIFLPGVFTSNGLPYSGQQGTFDFLLTASKDVAHTTNFFGIPITYNTSEVVAEEHFQVHVVPHTDPHLLV